MEQPALQILNDNRIMSIATVRPDGWPQSTIVGYANEGVAAVFPDLSHEPEIREHRPRQQGFGIGRT